MAATCQTCLHDGAHDNSATPEKEMAISCWWPQLQILSVVLMCVLLIYSLPTYLFLGGGGYVCMGMYKHEWAWKACRRLVVCHVIVWWNLVHVCTYVGFNQFSKVILFCNRNCMLMAIKFLKKTKRNLRESSGGYCCTQTFIVNSCEAHLFNKDRYQRLDEPHLSSDLRCHLAVKSGEDFTSCTMCHICGILWCHNASCLCWPFVVANAHLCCSHLVQSASR